MIRDAHFFLPDVAEKVKVERLWQLYLLITLSLDRKPGENGALPAPVIRALVLACVKLYINAFGSTPTAVSWLAHEICFLTHSQRYFHYLPWHMVTWKEDLESIGLSLADISTSMAENKQKHLRQRVHHNSTLQPTTYLEQVLEKELRIIYALEHGLLPIFLTEREKALAKKATMRRHARMHQVHRCAFREQDGGNIAAWLPSLLAELKHEASRAAADPALAKMCSPQIFDVDLAPLLEGGCGFCKDVSDGPVRVQTRLRRRRSAASWGGASVVAQAQPLQAGPAVAPMEQDSDADDGDSDYSDDGSETETDDSDYSDSDNDEIQHADSDNSVHDSDGPDAE